MVGIPGIGIFLKIAGHTGHSYGSKAVDLEKRRCMAKTTFSRFGVPSGAGPAMRSQESSPAARFNPIFIFPEILTKVG